MNVIKSLFAYSVLLAVLIGCNHPGLNEKQREQLKEGKLDRTIKKVNEAEILESIVLRGKQIATTFTKANDSVNNEFQAFWIYDSIAPKNVKQQELQEAYLYSKENGYPSPPYAEFLEGDSLLFAMPSLVDGTSGTWFIYFNKKEVVKNIQ